jgi:hypothetical protein
VSAFSLRRRLAVAAAAAGLLGVALPVASAVTASASADPRPGTITSVTARPGGWDYTGIYLSHGTVVLSGSGTVFVNGNLYGPVFSIPNTDYPCRGGPRPAPAAIACAGTVAAQEGA